MESVSSKKSVIKKRCLACMAKPSSSIPIGIIPCCMVMENINLSFYTYKDVIFYGKGKLKDCRKNLFRIYPYSHSRDAPAFCAAFAFSDLSGYKSFEN